MLAISTTEYRASVTRLFPSPADILVGEVGWLLAPAQDLGNEVLEAFIAQLLACAPDLLVGDVGTAGPDAARSLHEVAGPGGPRWPSSTALRISPAITASLSSRSKALAKASA